MTWLDWFEIALAIFGGYWLGRAMMETRQDNYETAERIELRRVAARWDAANFEIEREKVNQ